ncbi:class I SAM-dependent methyltransferase [Flavisolibacter nicotianae]|uniref:class I SAM-dependent methyltransferase n=1 Tax=Flavisolibacter nicotianae TaxID=2364882 RepID=UPI000EACE6B6|nr:class I SAM-dependent methyltransferase [Flavisolibacter nicotianae]
MNKEWTGERLETFVLNENTIEHLHRYAIALQYAKDKVVLDIASGEGYGSNLLAQSAEKVYGVDIDAATVQASKEKYRKRNLIFQQGSADAIPVEDNSVDVVVSFETIEHHDRHEEMMKEIKRVLKPGGVLILSSPDKKYYSDLPNYRNPFHIKELYFGELKALVQRHFGHSAFFLQGMFRGSLVVPENGAGGFDSFSGNYNEIKPGKGFRPVYNLAIASEQPIANPAFSVFDNDLPIRLSGAKDIVEARHQGVEAVRSSWSYRLGHLILSPLRIFRSR